MWEAIHDACRRLAMAVCPFTATEVHALGERFEVDAATRGRVLADLAGHPSLTCLAFESLGGTTWQALSGAALRGEGPLGQWMRDRAARISRWSFPAA